jgi:RND family efflux transporter MFP subunit
LSERLIGTVVSDNQVQLYPEVSGRIVRVEARNGDRVEQGQPLVYLEDSQYREQLQQAEANLRVSQAALRQAQARYRELEVEFKRIRNLAELGLSSRLEAETLGAQLESARASEELAEAQVEEARSSIEEARWNLSRSVVRAPITGTVGRRNAEPGMQVSSGSELFTIGDLSRLRVEIVLTEGMLGDLRVGQPVVVQTGSRAATVEARIARISPFLDTVTRTTLAEIHLPGSLSTLKPGMSVSVVVRLGESRPTSLVPVSAVVTHPATGESGVYVVSYEAPSAPDPGSMPGSSDSSFPVSFRPVQVIAEGPDEVGVAGVEAGDWVVIVGQDLLVEGRSAARVRPGSWERAMDLQSLRPEELLREALGE